MKEKVKFHNKHYNLNHLNDLYERAEEYLALNVQWSSKDCYVPANALEYWNKLEAIIELMESITVFHVGLGFCTGKTNSEISKQDNSLIGRLHSFKWIESVDFSTC